MTNPAHQPKTVDVPAAWPFPRPHPICSQPHCAVLSCCQQAGRCLGGERGPVADVEDALL
jgi:hypothetical protein